MTTFLLSFFLIFISLFVFCRLVLLLWLVCLVLFFHLVLLLLFCLLLNFVLLFLVVLLRSCHLLRFWLLGLLQFGLFLFCSFGLVIFFIDSISQLISVTWISTAISSISFVDHYSNFTKGILSVADTVFFLSIIALFNFLTLRVLEKRRWS